MAPLTLSERRGAISFVAAIVDYGPGVVSTVIALVGVAALPRGAPIVLPLNAAGSRPELPRVAGLIVSVAVAWVMTLIAASTTSALASVCAWLFPLFLCVSIAVSRAFAQESNRRNTIERGRLQVLDMDAHDFQS